MIRCFRDEINMRKNFLKGENINTIYFGGGTPSIINAGSIEQILGDIYKLFRVTEKPEITLEANPDDISVNKLKELKEAGINRLSIGVQSFNNENLKKLNRVHDSATALNSLEAARRSGFDNINADLIFSINSGYLPVLKEDLQTMNKFRPEHLSIYCLTIESGTVFGNWQKKGLLRTSTDDEAATEYEFIMDDLEAAGYDHYEISNFSLKGFHSRHNTGYWLNEKYLGIGPSAHSYDRINRYSNISNNALYIKSIESNKIPETIEALTTKDRINEYIMTSLRTKWGCDLQYIKIHFGENILAESGTLIDTMCQQGYMFVRGNNVALTRKGKLIADELTSRLFIS